MKKIITKFFLISLFTSICFFGIDRVYAVDHYVAPQRIGVYDGTWYGDFTNNMITSDNIMLIIHSVQLSSYDAVTFDYSNTQLDLEIGRKYDFAFYIYYDYRTSISLNNLSVTMGNKACVVSPANISYSVQESGIQSEYSTSRIMAVSCSAVDVVSTVRIRIIRRAIAGENDLHYIGVSSFIYTADNSEQILKDIKNSNDDVKSAIANSNQKLDETNDKLQETNDTLKDDDVSESSDEAESFFSGFTTDTHGLTSIITAPLTLIGSITSSTCSPLGLKVPFVENKTLNLPCMSSIYKKNFGSFMTVYQTITFGIVAYWVCVRIFALVKDFKNPEKDEVEVMDL